MELLQYILPKEVVESFELKEIKEDSDKVLHFYLEEKNVVPKKYESIGLRSNGFYQESSVKDYPIRDKKVILHLKRRRWLDSSGKSYSEEMILSAEGTRYSKEFAAFLKEHLR